MYNETVAHRFPHRSGWQSIRPSGSFYAESLVGSSVVVKADPLSDYSRGVLLGFEAMTKHALLFKGSDDAFDHAVLPQTVRRDELLPKTITGHEARVGSRRKRARCLTSAGTL